MHLRNANADEWWSKQSPDEKSVYRGLIVIAMDLLDGEALRVSFSADGLSPRLITSNSRSMAAKLVVMPDMSEDQWWALSTPQTQTWTRNLAKLMQDLAAHPDKALQVVNKDQALTMDLVPVAPPAAN